MSLHNIHNILKTTYLLWVFWCHFQFSHNLIHIYPFHIELIHKVNAPLDSYHRAQSLILHLQKPVYKAETISNTSLKSLFSYPLQILLDFITSATIGEEYWSRWIYVYRSCVVLNRCINEPFLEYFVSLLLPIFTCVFLRLFLFLGGTIAVFFGFLPIRSSTSKWWLRVLLLLIISRTRIGRYLLLLLLITRVSILSLLLLLLWWWSVVWSLLSVRRLLSLLLRNSTRKRLLLAWSRWRRRLTWRKSLMGLSLIGTIRTSITTSHIIIIIINVIWLRRWERLWIRMPWLWWLLWLIWLPESRISLLLLLLLRLWWRLKWIHESHRGIENTAKKVIHVLSKRLWSLLLLWEISSRLLLWSRRSKTKHVDPLLL